MTISKYIRRDHAYVGQAFSTTRDLGRGRQNVILSGGQVTEAAPFAAASIAIAPFIMELGGLVIQSDTAIAVPYTQPTNPGKSLFLVVSSPDDTDASGLVWTVLTRVVDYTAGFIFAVRHNLGGSTPGATWSQPPTGSLRSILHRLENPLQHRSERTDLIDAGHFRPEVVPDLTAAPVVIRGPATGLLSASLGAALGFDNGGFVLPPPHHTYPRRDRLVLRRTGAGPLDRSGESMFGGAAPGALISAEPAMARHATIDLIPGVPRRTDIAAAAAAFVQPSAVKAAGQADVVGGRLAADVNKHVVARDGTYTRATGYNSLYVAYQNDATDDLVSLRVDADRTTVPGATDILAGAVGILRDDLDMVILPTGGAMILYTYNGGAGHEKLYMSTVDPDGLAFGLVDTAVYDFAPLLAAADIRNPKGFVDQDGSIQIVMEVELNPAGGGANGFGNALYWMKISVTGVALSAPIRLTDPGAGVAPQPAVQDPSVQYVDGKLLVTATRILDQTAATLTTEGIYLSCVEGAQISQVTMTSAATTAQADPVGRTLSLGSYLSGSTVDTVVAVGPNGLATAAIFSSTDNSNTEQRYVHYGSPGAPELASFQKRNDGNTVAALALAHHSDQLGSATAPPTLSESSLQLAAIHDGMAVHVVGWDAVNLNLVYERAVPHALNDLPFAGELTTRFNLLPDGAAAATIPADLVMCRAASGELIVVRIPAAGADGGAVLVTEILGVEGEPDPLTPDVTVLAEFDLPGGVPGVVDITPTMVETSRTTRPSRDLIVGGGGGPGGLVGSAGLQLALETLKGSGGTIRVRAGFYDVFHPLALTSGIEVKCDPGAVIRSRSTAGQGAISVAGADISITTVDSGGIATFTGLGGHLRALGYTEGCLLTEKATGTEFYITEILEAAGKFRLDTTTPPVGAYTLCQTGITWTGGTFVGDFLVAVRLNRAAHVSIRSIHVKTGTTGTPALFSIDGCSDVRVREFFGDLGVNGALLTSSAPALRNKGISIRECRFTNGLTIGLVHSWDGFDLVDLTFDGNTNLVLSVTDSTGQVDRIRNSTTGGTLTITPPGRVVVGDTDFGTQNDVTRLGPFSDTKNKPNFTDAWFRGNVYVSGFLNHGQYDTAIMALAMIVADDNLFQLYGMTDGIAEDFLTFEDVELNAFYPVPSTSLFGRWYPSVAPLVLDAPGPSMPEALIGLSDRVAPDYILDGFNDVVAEGDFDEVASGGLRGRHASLRGVIHHTTAVAGSFTKEGYPDRGKIEMQASWGSAAEGEDLVGEVASYALLNQNLASLTGTDGEQIEFSSVRYDVNTGLLVGLVGNAGGVGGVPQNQRVYDAYTSLGSNRITTVSTVVNSPGGTAWGLVIQVDVFNATTGAHIGGSYVRHGTGPSGSNLWSPIIWVHRVNPGVSVETYGELAEAKLVPDLSDPTKLWLFMVGRFDNNAGGALPLVWESALRVAYIDLSATPANMLLDLPAEPAGTKWKNLDSASVATSWRGLSVAPIADNFNGSMTNTNNYVVGVMKSGGVNPATGVGVYLLNIGVFNDTVGDFEAPGGMATSAGAGFTGFIPCAMANDIEQDAMIGNGVVDGDLSDEGSWPWKPLSGGTYIGGGDPRATFLLAGAPDKTTWVGSTLTAIHVPWAAAAAWNAPGAAVVLATGAISLSHMPGALWDSDAAALRWVVPYAAGNLFGFSLHTEDSVNIDEATWGGAAWTWGGAAAHKALGPARVRNLVSASVADQDDATGLQRLNVAWQGQAAGVATTWGSVQVTSASPPVVTQGVWYDAHNPELSDATFATRNMARYWMADGEWNHNQRLATPTSTDTLDREHYLLYNKDITGAWAEAVFLRCVGRQLAVKVEFDIPWGNNLNELTLRVRSGGETNGAGAAVVEGLRGFPQNGFRTSEDLTNAGASPINDTYDGTAPLFVATGDGWQALGAWTGIGLSGTANNLVTANVGQRDIFTLTLAHNVEKWTVGSRIIALETQSEGPLAGVTSEQLLSLMVGQTVLFTGVGGAGAAREHRITYFGKGNNNLYSMIVEPPMALAPHATAAQNTLTFRKRMVGAVLLPPAGSASLVHPERLWINQMELEAERAPTLDGVQVDSSPAVVPVSTQVVVMQLIDTDGTFTAEVNNVGGANLADYLEIYLSRDAAGAEWQWVDFFPVDTGNAGANPLTMTPMGDGSTQYIVFALHTWPIALGPLNFPAYRVEWNPAGGFPSKGLHLERISIGWS